MSDGKPVVENGVLKWSDAAEFYKLLCELLRKVGIDPDPEPRPANLDSKFHRFVFKCDNAAGAYGHLLCDGRELSHVHDVELYAAVDTVNEVRVTFVATPVDFDVQGRFVPLVQFPDVEEAVARELYEKLKERFKGTEG